MVDYLGGVKRKNPILCIGSSGKRRKEIGVSVF
jgi:hypothetical protein